MLSTQFFCHRPRLLRSIIKAFYYVTFIFVMEQSTFCCLCNVNTPFEQQIVIMPCNHVLCFPCMIEAQAAAIYNPPFRCPLPSCGIIIERHYLLIRTAQTRSRTRQSNSTNEEHVRKEYLHSDYNPNKEMLKLRENCNGIRIGLVLP